MVEAALSSIAKNRTSYQSAGLLNDGQDSLFKANYLYFIAFYITIYNWQKSLYSPLILSNL
jgi:hypothetical protein